MLVEKDSGCGKRRAVSAIIIIIFIIALTACSHKGSEQPLKKPAAPVTIESVLRKAVPLQIHAIGNVEAYSSVSVKSQVGGQLSRVHFREGQDVKKGDPLFTIDPRPFEAQMKQAEANLLRDKAQLSNAIEEARRYGELVNRGYIAKEQYEQFRTNASVLDATVQADKAVLENAHLQLRYCFIQSPVTGRTGNLLVDEGNIIKANADNSMVVINRIQPIYVSFSIPEHDFPDIKRYMSAGKLRVEAFSSRDDKEPEPGVVTFVDNAVDPATGTIKLKGTFANEGKRLWPGQFVNIVVTLTTQQDAVVVPSAAVQTGQKGQFVFVVGEDSTVEARPVEVSRIYGEETVILQGLRPGEKVVTDGQLRLMPGSKVEIKQTHGAEGRGQGAKGGGQKALSEPETFLRDKGK